MKALQPSSELKLLTSKLANSISVVASIWAEIDSSRSCVGTGSSEKPEKICVEVVSIQFDGS